MTILISCQYSHLLLHLKARPEIPGHQRQNDRRHKSSVQSHTYTASKLTTVAKCAHSTLGYCTKQDTLYIIRKWNQKLPIKWTINVLFTATTWVKSLKSCESQNQKHNIKTLQIISKTHYFVTQTGINGLRWWHAKWPLQLITIPKWFIWTNCNKQKLQNVW